VEDRIAIGELVDALMDWRFRGRRARHSTVDLGYHEVSNSAKAAHLRPGSRHKEAAARLDPHAKIARSLRLQAQPIAFRSDCG
jgi:hypothetical protein